jgi:hypothetical protein
VRRDIATGVALCALVGIVAASGANAVASFSFSVYRVERVADGDTITLRNGQRVQLVQIDTPEVYIGQECFGQEASARTKKLLPPGTRVHLFPEPAGDRVDDFGRGFFATSSVSPTRSTSTFASSRSEPPPRGSTTAGSAVTRPYGQACQDGHQAEPRALARLPRHEVRPVRGDRDTPLAPSETRRQCELRSGLCWYPDTFENDLIVSGEGPPTAATRSWCAAGDQRRIRWRSCRPPRFQAIR